MIERRDAVWDALGLGKPYDTMPPRADIDDEALLFDGLGRSEDKHAYLAEIFDDRGDVLPTSRAALAAKLGDLRLVATPKLIHRLGACAKVRLEVVAASPYTGLLAPNAVVHGILRASLTSLGRFAPGIAMKWFPAEGPSENVVANETFEGFPDSEGFFARPFRTELAPPHTSPFGRTEHKAAGHAAAGLFQATLAWWQANPRDDVPPNPLKLDLRPLCSVDVSGRAVELPRAPASLTFRGDRDANAQCRDGAEDFRVGLAQIRPAELLDVYDDHDVHLGTVHLEDRFVSSPGGDALLYFHHPFPR